MQAAEFGNYIDWMAPSWAVTVMQVNHDQCIGITRWF